jgi:hypothetical protein
MTSELKARAERWKLNGGSARLSVPLREIRAALDHIASLEAERDRCHARLEIDHHFVMVGDDKLERREVPLDERAAEIDGIEARDCTIALQDEQIAKLQAALDAARALDGGEGR